jgi:hypothetical protein
MEAESMSLRAVDWHPLRQALDASTKKEVFVPNL